MERKVLSEEAHPFPILHPIDIDGGKSSDIFNMENAVHASIKIMLGVTGGASTITVEECDDVTPTNNTAIAFNYYAEETAAGDTLGDRTAATSAGFATSTNDNVYYVIEIDACELSDGYNYLRVVCSDPGAATIGSIDVTLSGNRYSPPQKTALA